MIIYYFDNMVRKQANTCLYQSVFEILRTLRRVWIYQRGNQNQYIEEQTTQCPKEKGQRDKQRSTKHTHKTKNDSNLTKNRGWTQVLRKGKQLLLHYWHPSCYSSYKPGDKSWMKKGPGSVYDKWKTCSDRITDNHNMFNWSFDWLNWLSNR
jgi:hypothetical protein